MNENILRRKFLRIGGSALVYAAAPQLWALEDTAFEVGQSWVDSKVDVKKGDTLEVRADGNIHLGGEYREHSGPDGWTKKAEGGDYPFPNGNKYGLIACIGDVRSRGYFPIGSHRKFEAPRDGRLLFTINDNRLCDNTGFFGVKVDYNGKVTETIVPGDGGFWLDTKLNIETGKEYIITASGEIDIGGADKEKSAPKGWDMPKKGEWPMMNAPRYSLIGCIGNNARGEPQDGRYLYIGDELEFQAKRSGRLCLGINDHFHSDNTGAYKVKVVEAKK